MWQGAYWTNNVALTAQGAHRNAERAMKSFAERHGLTSDSTADDWKRAAQKDRNEIYAQLARGMFRTDTNA
jgi:hypothetical protein